MPKQSQKKPSKSIQSRLLKPLLIGLPAIWLSVMAVTNLQLWEEMSEMGDTQVIQLAHALSVTTQSLDDNAPTRVLDEEFLERLGGSDEDHMGFAVWSKEGRLLLADDNGKHFSLKQETGFYNRLNTEESGSLAERWRLFYIKTQEGRLVAVGQNLESRQELIITSLIAQSVPALAGLLLFVILVWWSVRRSFSALRTVSESLAHRQVQDDRPIDTPVPKEIAPLVTALNHWFVKVSDTLAREERFTADAAHELRSPLTALRLEADMLETAVSELNDSHTDHTALLERTLAIKNATIKSTHLIDQLLILAKLAPDVPLSPETLSEIDWLSLSDSVLKDSNLAAREKHSQLKRQLSDTPLSLVGNPTLIELMLRNLIDNAIRYCPPHSTITLEIQKDHIAVRDNGHGVAKEDLARLSERFFRPSGQKENGSGLGLSIVWRIGELHGLKCQLENLHTADGHVAGFLVTLSRSPAH
ncbi:MAG: ATP-binding protein [Moraxella sp.]|nr:ATP-binding protein [Moraxella sp.]